MSKNTMKICTVEFESTETSHPFEKRVLTFKPGAEQEIGRVGKKPPSSFEKTLLFDTRTISRKHAKLVFQRGSLYLLDLNSSHGTHVNGKTIPVNGNEDPKTHVSNACEVKTGDIVRFGTTRKTCSSGEVLAAIEGRLTVTIATAAKEKAKNMHALTKDPNEELVQPYTPSDGPQLVENERNQARRSTSPKMQPPKCDARKWSMLQPAETGQKGTLTDSIDTTTNSSQTVPSAGETHKDHPSYYDQWQETVREFSVYRRQTLKLIVICLLVAVLYHLVANSLEGTLSSINRRHFRI